MYTAETDTGLYNRLVPWGIAMYVRSNDTKEQQGKGSPREQRNVREVKLHEICAHRRAQQ